ITTLKNDILKLFDGIERYGSAQDLYHQIDALNCLENIRQVWVSTVLGSPAPTLSVRLMQIFISGTKDASVIDKKLTFDAASGMYVLETLPESIDVGSYIFSFEIIFDTQNIRKTMPLEGEQRLNLPGDNE
ncbi:hypothetical protein C2S51_037272, partial [Perilla frutescens var. frutescens]